MSAVIHTSAQSAARRLLNRLLAVYWSWRLRDAEEALEGFKRELVNRTAEMELHRHWCEACRVRITLLRN